MSIGMILLTVVAILVFFGVAQRVLDKLHLSDRMALLLIALMFLGTLLPNISLGRISIGIGGVLIPSGICIYLLTKAGTAKERIRAVVGAVLTGAAVFALSRLLPDEPEQMLIEPMYLYGIVGGIVAYLLGRSRRAAFICGVWGVALADVAVGVINAVRGTDQPLIIGGAGIFDAIVISGIIGVLLAELVGETLERLTRGNRRPQHSTVHDPIRQKER